MAKEFDDLDVLMSDLAPQRHAPLADVAAAAAALPHSKNSAALAGDSIDDLLGDLMVRNAARNMPVHSTASESIDDLLASLEREAGPDKVSVRSGHASGGALTGMDADYGMLWQCSGNVVVRMLYCTLFICFHVRL